MSKIIKLTNKFLQDNELDQYLTKKYFDYGLIVFSILLGFYLKWKIEDVAVFVFVVWIILNPISSQLLAKGSLILLSLVPLLLMIKRENRAEQFAIFAYYFLIMAVIVAIVELKKEKNQKPKPSRKKK